MRRSPIVLGATVLGTAGVLAFHPHAPAAERVRAATTATPATSTSRRAAVARTPTRTAAATTTASATGDAIATQYGNAQVRVTVRSGRIVGIQPLELQGSDPRSVEISSTAEPILRQEALAKQTADIDAVSGATFTSASYAQSLQSALDKLGFKTASRTALQVP